MNTRKVEHMDYPRSKVLISFENTQDFKTLVSHRWTGSYLLKPYGAHFRKSLRILSKKILRVGSDWIGNSVWDSPVVGLAPPS